jgi:hypothetical protein
MAAHTVHAKHDVPAFLSIYQSGHLAAPGAFKQSASKEQRPTTDPGVVFNSAPLGVL